MLVIHDHAQSLVQLSSHECAELRRLSKEIDPASSPKIHEKLIKILNTGEDAALTTEIIAGSLIAFGVAISIIIARYCASQTAPAGILYGYGIQLQEVTVDVSEHLN